MSDKVGSMTKRGVIQKILTHISVYWNNQDNVVINSKEYEFEK